MIWENKTGEADRVITLLTPSGVVSAYAKNSLLPRNKLTTPTAMLSYSDFELFSGKNMYTVDDASVKHRFVKLYADAAGYALAIYFCELLKLLAPIGDDAGDFLSLALNTFYLLNDGKKEQMIVKAVFELRAASYAGYMPDLVACRDCGTYGTHSAYFDLSDGTWLCENCAAANAKTTTITGGTLQAMRHILYSDLAKAFSFALSDRSKPVLSETCEQFLNYQLDRSLTTLAFYKTMLP